MPTSAQFRSCPGSFDILPLHRIRTSYAALRPGRPTVETEPLSPLPIRVVPVDDNEGAYEVIDGFKRLEAWREQGHQNIPVVLEAPGKPEDHKRLLLLAKRRSSHPDYDG